MIMLNPSLRRWSWRLAVLATLGAGGYFAWQHYARPKPIDVNVAKASLGRVEATVANTRAGTVKACRRAKLAPQGGGQIAHLLVREGDRVKAGQVLLELWNVDLAAQARQAEEQVLTARAHRAEACAAARAARREGGRQEKLVAQGFVSAAKVDAAVSEAEVKEAGCHAAEADIATAVARLETARATLSRSVLRAPFAGIVAEVTGEQGEYTTPSPPGIPTPPAIDLIDDACLYVTAPIDEVDAPKIRVGLPPASRWTPSPAGISRDRSNVSPPTCWKWKSRRARWKWKWPSPSRAKQKPCWWAIAPMRKSFCKRARRCCAFPPRRCLATTRCCC